MSSTPPPRQLRSTSGPRVRSPAERSPADRSPAGEPPAPAADSPRSRLHDALRLRDPRGLTATGAVGLALLLGAVGAAVDVATGPGLRTTFAVCFVLGCVAAAAGVHREHLRTAVVMPPLVYVVLAFAGSVVERAGDPGSFVTRQALELANSLFLGAPVLLTATALAAAVALYRGVTGAGGPGQDRPAGPPR